MSLLRDFEKIDKMVNRINRGAERGITENYAELYRQLRNKLSAVFSKYADSRGNLTIDEMAKYNRLDSLNKSVSKIIQKSYVSTAREIRGGVRDVARSTYDETIAAVSDAAGRQITGKLQRETITESLQDPRSGMTLNRRLSVRRNDIIQRIEQEVTRGLARGDNFRNISRIVKQELEQDAAKAIRIVRTEGHRVQEQSKLNALDHAKAQGVRMMKRWVSSQDERVRASHEHMHGQTVPYESNFVNKFTGGEGPAPGMMGPAEDDINCRCTFVVEIITGKAA